MLKEKYLLPGKRGFRKFHLVNKAENLNTVFFYWCLESRGLSGFPTRLPGCREKGVFPRPVDIEVLVHKNEAVLRKLRCIVHSA
jgi:hypothetical protein